MFGNVVLTVLTAMLMCVLVIVGFVVIAFLRKLNKEKDLNIDDSIFKSIEQLVYKIVTTYNQTLVDNLKKANADGKLTEAQQQGVFDTVKNIILNLLSSEQVQCLMDKFGDLDDGVFYMIQNCVSYSKVSVIQSGELVVDKPNEIPTGFCVVDVTDSKINSVNEVTEGEVDLRTAQEVAEDLAKELG